MDKNRLRQIRMLLEQFDLCYVGNDSLMIELKDGAKFLLAAVDELQAKLGEAKKIEIGLINRIDDIGDELYDVNQAFEVVEGLYEVQATRISKLEVENKRFSDILYKWFGMNYEDGKEAFDAMILVLVKEIRHVKNGYIVEVRWSYGNDEYGYSEVICPTIQAVFDLIKQTDVNPIEEWEDLE